MRTLYFECNMGAAGDMLCASLFELLSEEGKAEFLDKMNSLDLPGVTVSAERAKKCGMIGTYFSVTVCGVEELESNNHEHRYEHNMHHHEHRHATPDDIYKLINGLNVSENVRKGTKDVYSLIAEAEAKVHGTAVELVHFHEVGALDAVADVVGFCLLIEMLCVDKVMSSIVTTGAGSVKTAHGILPVPAPATAALLTGIPTRAGHVESELCTPTGAALLRHFSASFGKRPDMIVEAIGYGMGFKDFEGHPNCVRAFLGETDVGTGEELYELRCTVDDMTSEAAAFACERIMEAGARDIYVQQVIMKKGRPGFVFVCLCDENDGESFTRLLLKHTTTLGVRQFKCTRQSMDREITEVDTPEGILNVKHSHGFGISRSKPEYEDVAKIAREQDLSFMEAEKLIRGYYK